jgi:mono-ADP-ribosyltransferase sirtuin 6
MSSHPTGKVCTNQNCGGKLHDTLLDWEDELPEDDFEIAEKQCDKADLIVCLGTSLRIQPVGRFPLRARKFVIVNLQQTPRDSEASLIIRAPVDKVMDGLLQRLGYSDWRVEPSPEIERKWCR